MNQVLNENERLLEQVMSKDIVNLLVNPFVENDFVNVHECQKCLKLETGLQTDLVKRETYDKLFKSFTILEKHCISLEVDTQLKQEIFQRENSVSNQSVPSFDQLFELNELKAQSQEKDIVIKKLKERIKSLSGKMDKDKIKQDFEEIETIDIELDHRDELRKLLATTTLKDELRKLKGKTLVDNNVSNHPSDPELHQANVEPITPKLLNKKTAHSTYIKHSQEEVAVLRDLVNHIKANYPLDPLLESAPVNLGFHGFQCSIFSLMNEVVQIVLCIWDSDCSKHMTEIAVSAHQFRQQNSWVLSIRELGLNYSLWDNFLIPNHEVAVPSTHLATIRNLEGGGTCCEYNEEGLAFSRNICCLPTLHSKTVFLLYPKSFHDTPSTGKTPYELLHNKPPNLSYLHVFGALCYPTNDSENLESTSEADTSSSGPALHAMTPATISSGLVLNTHPSTPFVPPSRTDWDMLFQSLFDEFLNPSPSVGNLAPEVVALINAVIAPVLADSTGTPSSTTVDQDAPSPSNSQTTSKTLPSVIPNDVEENNHDIEVAHMGTDPYFGVPIPEIPSDQPSSSDTIHIIIHPDH
ncbi:hypothetical protein Tco_1213182 [Tanacetum coccineum]